MKPARRLGAGTSVSRLNQDLATGPSPETEALYVEMLR